MIFAEPGTIELQHGHTCAEPAEAALPLREAVPFPRGLDEGTVIFNGGLAGYTGGDSHHVRMLGAGAIFDVVNIDDGASGRELRWNALVDEGIVTPPLSKIPLPSRTT